jgi:hypothetical protein
VDSSAPYAFTLVSPTGWISNQSPAVVIQFSTATSGIALTSVEFAFSVTGSLTPVNWADVDGVYTDMECTISAMNGDTGVLFARVNTVLFNQDSAELNTICFRATDIAGNQYPGDDIFTIKVDISPPGSFSVYSPTNQVDDLTPMVIFQFLVEASGVDISSVMYAYSTTGELTPDNWNPVDGVYQDVECTIPASNGTTGWLYAKINAVPFNNVSVDKNTIRLCCNDMTSNFGIQASASIIHVQSLPAETPFWNELWFWGLIASGVVLTAVVIPATAKSRRYKKNRVKYQRMNENFAFTRDVNLFVSYSHVDDGRFQIPRVVETLRTRDHIAQVVYSQKDTKDDFIKYMNEKIGESDGILLFCSKTSNKSEFVNSEWMAAMAASKPVIPIFMDKNDIPPLLKGKLGVEFREKKLEETNNAIYAVVKRQLGEVKDNIKSQPRKDNYITSGDIAEASGDIAEVSGDIVEASGDFAEASGDITEASGDIAEASVISTEIGVLSTDKVEGSILPREDSELIGLKFVEAYTSQTKEETVDTLIVPSKSQRMKKSTPRILGMFGAIIITLSCGFLGYLVLTDSSWLILTLGGILIENLCLTVAYLGMIGIFLDGWKKSSFLFKLGSMLLIISIGYMGSEILFPSNNSFTQIWTVPIVLNPLSGITLGIIITWLGILLYFVGSIQFRKNAKLAFLTFLLFIFISGLGSIYQVLGWGEMFYLQWIGWGSASLSEIMKALIIISSFIPHAWVIARAKKSA